MPISNREDIMTNEEQALMQAAQAYSTLNGRISGLQEQLNEALAALEGRNARIEQLERAILEDTDRYKLYEAELYNRMRSLEAERDQALIERDQTRVILASLRVQLDAIELPLPAPPLSLPAPSKKKRSPSEDHPNGPLAS